MVSVVHSFVCKCLCLQSKRIVFFSSLPPSLHQGAREEGAAVDMAKAQREARELYQAGEQRWGTDESKFNQIIAVRSHPQLRATFDEYVKVCPEKYLQLRATLYQSHDLQGWYHQEVVYDGVHSVLCINVLSVPVPKQKTNAILFRYHCCVRSTMSVNFCSRVELCIKCINI